MPSNSTRAAAAGLTAAALFLGAAPSGCGGERQTADAFWSSGKPGDEGRAGSMSVPDEFSESPLALQPDEQMSAWVGVRHDLMLAPSPGRKERCSCLAVEVGGADDPRFQWAAGAPQLGGGAVSLALSARGVPCPGGDADEEKRRPSISAVDQEGNDIIVEVEELRDGRPLATGAVVPRPAAGGAIYVKGRSPKLPYARALNGVRCKVF